MWKCVEQADNESAISEDAINEIRFKMSSSAKVQDDGWLVSAMPNVRANRPAEARGVSLVRDDAPSAADQAYAACRSGSGGSARG